jgi:cytochrome c oxidase cbb3-type subunit III
MTTTTIDDAAVPAEAPGEPRLLAHSYDGIREYDNPLPGWWRAIFWGSIVFAAGYFVWFQVAGYGETPDQKYRAALAEYQGKKNARDAEDVANVNEDMLKRFASDPTMVEHGSQVFATRCATCHAADGRGLIGPNLTDLDQLHGETRVDIYRTVRGGVAGTAMPAWGEQLPAGDVVAAATFVITLRGKNVVGGKAPQGQPVQMFDR